MPDGTVPGPRQSDGYPGAGDFILDALVLALFAVAAWIVLAGSAPLPSAVLIGVLAVAYAAKCLQARMLYRHGYDDGAWIVMDTVVDGMTERTDLAVDVWPLYDDMEAADA